MQQQYKIVFIIALFLTATPLLKAQDWMRKDSVFSIMKRVAQWQMKSYDQKHSNDTNWENGALFVGMNHWAAKAKEQFGDDQYYNWLKKIAERNYWRPGPRLYHADDFTVLQTWLNLSEFYKNPDYACPTVERLDYVIAYPSDAPLDLRVKRNDNFKRWSWCDALFMAPPVFLKLYLMTGKKKYLKFMHQEYKATTDYLYDKEEHLFFRDSRYFNQSEANGKKIFWGRGNGWVVAGLAELLRQMPEKCKYRNYYLNLFKEMCAKLKDIQQPDGYWRASLLDPASYPTPETSSTGFIAYAMAWGVNAGILDKKEYRPAAEKGWKAMCEAVFPDGKLGYVQPIGADPKKVTRDMTQVYGTGAFLALGCEIAKF